MNHSGLRLGALMLALCLLFSTASASGLDEALGGYVDLNHDVRYAMSAQLETLTPYAEGTIDMLNGVLRHMSISAELTDDETIVDFCVSGDPVMTLTETRTETGSELTTPLLPNRTLTSAGSVIGRLGGTAEKQEKFDLLNAISELEGCYRDLTDAILPYAEEKKANYKITDIATSKWSRIARLTVEQGAEIAPLIEKVLGCGMDEAFRETLRGLKTHKGFIVGLYQSEQNGRDLALYMKGYITFADGKARNLAYQWAFNTKDGVRTDTLKYELVKSKHAVDTREIHAKLKRRADDQLLFKGNCEAAIKDADGNITTVHTYDLSGQDKSGVRPVTGSVTIAVKTREGETTTTDTTTITPDLRLTSSEGSGVLSGTVSLEQKTGKVVHTALKLVFDEEPARLLSQAAQSGVLFAVSDPEMPQSSLSQNIEMPDKPEDYLVGAPPIGLTAYNAPETMQVVDVDAEGQLDALMGEWTQNLAGKLLIALARIPEEDMALIRDNMSEEDFAAFLAMVDDL